MSDLGLTRKLALIALSQIFHQQRCLEYRSGSEGVWLAMPSVGLVDPFLKTAHRFLADLLPATLLTIRANSEEVRLATLSSCPDGLLLQVSEG